MNKKTTEESFEEANRAIDKLKSEEIKIFNPNPNTSGTLETAEDP